MSEELKRVNKYLEGLASMRQFWNQPDSEGKPSNNDKCTDDFVVDSIHTDYDVNSANFMREPAHLEESDLRAVVKLAREAVDDGSDDDSVSSAEQGS